MEVDRLVVGEVAATAVVAVEAWERSLDVVVGVGRRLGRPVAGAVAAERTGSVAVAAARMPDTWALVAVEVEGALGVVARVVVGVER